MNFKILLLSNKNANGGYGIPVSITFTPHDTDNYHVTGQRETH